ncbi:MAG: hypothetical protein AAFQ98_27170, partial [Bacteroidota bacterium]
ETRAQFMSEAQAQPDFLSAMALATPLFDAIGCDHCQLFNDQAYFAATPTKEIRAEDYSEAFLVQYNAESNDRMMRFIAEIVFASLRTTRPSRCPLSAV